jgi:small-conductance mechanosensitive channel/GNAT superfamily N-acetyltransferase
VSAASARLARAALIALALAPWPVAAQTTEPPQRPLSALEAEAEAQTPAAVMIGGEPVIFVTVGAGPYTTEVRASRIAARIYEAIADRTIGDPTVNVVEVEDSSELRVGARLLMVVTAPDARNLGVARATMAQTYAREIERAIRNERLRRAPGALLRSGITGLVATAVFAIVVFLILRMTRWLRRRADAWRAARIGALRVQNAEIVSADRLGRAIDKAFRVGRLVLLLLAFDLYLTYVLGLFPWTRAVSYALLDYVVTPARTVARAFIGYLPNLVFVVVIVLVFRGIIRLVALFFRQIEEGRMTFPNFPPEWADPTYKIARLLLIAFGLVVVFPYLPASDSAAFAGVSVFFGVLLSLSSSSAISNGIAGVVLTYTGAFRLGDRVKVGDNFGDIIETSMLVTRMRTIKNEDVTIPNSLVLSTSMTNYSRQAGTMGLILHTSVTIGYDAPWRTIHGLLIEAARATPEILETPAPFVWQTALNDFYVTYEINAYTANARDMVNTYAVLHANIQDAFFAAGVEIMSPHFTAVRDGNTVTIPEANRPPGYQAPAFRVTQVGVEPAARPRS